MLPVPPSASATPTVPLSFPTAVLFFYCLCVCLSLELPQTESGSCMKWQQFICMVVPASRMREQEEWGRERQGPEKCVLELVTTLQNWVMWLAPAVVPVRNHVEHTSVLFLGWSWGSHLIHVSTGWRLPPDRSGKTQKKLKFQDTEETPGAERLEEGCWNYPPGYAEGIWL